MKKLLLVRHAKSDWGNPALEDFERPLNDRGKKDAPAMAKRLLEKKIIIDAILSSTAKRAAKTAKSFAEVYELKKSRVFFTNDLYMAGDAAFYTAIENAEDKFDTIALFSHNPGLTDFANQLTDARIDNIPTCGVFAIKVNTDTWKEFKSATKEFWFFDYPKSIL
ncbi:MAG TPA: histidine phosphatase family protein [Chitinophagaceae bacterium]|nr:histidine phosphatase family protein [Chitinophagaceae bacterium]